MPTRICGFFDHDGTGDTTYSKFDSATFDCYWIGELHPTSLVVTTSERRTSTGRTSERNKPSVSESERNKIKVTSSDRVKAKTSKSQRSSGKVTTSEG